MDSDRVEASEYRVSIDLKNFIHLSLPQSRIPTTNPEFAKDMATISNLDVFYLSRAQYIEEEQKKGNLAVVYEECDRMLQDPKLPFYYRGHFHLLLSGGDEDPVGHARQGVTAFDRMMFQSPGDVRIATYVLYARKVLRMAEQRILRESSGGDAEEEGLDVQSANDNTAGVLSGESLGKFGARETALAPESKVEGPPVSGMTSLCLRLRAHGEEGRDMVGDMVFGQDNSCQSLGKERDGEDLVKELNAFYQSIRGLKSRTQSV